MQHFAQKYFYSVYHKRAGVSKNYQCRREVQTGRKVGSQRRVSIKKQSRDLLEISGSVLNGPKDNFLYKITYPVSYLPA